MILSSKWEQKWCAFISNLPLPVMDTILYSMMPSWFPVSASVAAIVTTLVPIETSSSMSNGVVELVKAGVHVSQTGVLSFFGLIYRTHIIDCLLLA